MVQNLVFDVFDTECLGYEIFGKGFKSSLFNVEKNTGIKGECFHNTGNDANYSLRAMLLLAIYRYNTTDMDEATKARLEMYSRIAQF
jgi:hypothetical protein